MVGKERAGVYRALRKAVETGQGGVLFTVVDPESQEAEKLLLVDGRPAAGNARPAVIERAVAQAERRDRAWDVSVESWSLSSGETVRVVVEWFGPAPDVLILGAGHIAQPLSRICAVLGFQVRVLDDREAYATAARFPDADQVMVADFDEGLERLPIRDETHVVIVTRAHRHDYRCLKALRGTHPAYIGMIGSRRRVATVLRELADAGVSQDWMDRIHAPIGLDIGAQTPEEIALAIAAEIVNVRREGNAASLRWRPPARRRDRT